MEMFIHFNQILYELKIYDTIIYAEIFDNVNSQSCKVEPKRKNENKIISQAI